MKKVAILTINDDMNIGNRLQNYAVQKMFEKFNVEAETISNQEGIYGIKYVKKSIKNFAKKFFRIKKETRRYNNFMKFNKNLKYSKFKIDKFHIPNKLKEEYDYFFTGSDQVWNPNFKERSDVDFLTFVSKEKRNSISASFGVNNIPEKEKERYKKNLINIKNISVREDRGKEIVEELTGRTDVEVLVDPTMFLTAEEWDKVSKEPEQLKSDKKYILNYFLGKLSDERKAEIERIAKENDCEIINILDKNDSFYETGPSEFLYLEKHAFLICTDSFHSCVFAILYNRPFVVFEREQVGTGNMNSRIETLLTKFKLRDRTFNGKITKENLEHDYSEAYKILEIEREKSKKFLEKALDVESEKNEH